MARRSASPPPLAEPLTVVAASVGFFLVILDSTAVNVALPRIGAALDGSLQGLQWIVDGYLIALAGGLLAAGAVSDRIGARRAFRIGIAGFVLASLLCAAAPSAGALIVARVLQGATAAIALPASLALVRHTQPDEARRARAISAWSAVASLGIAFGPLVGGALTSGLGWRWVFLLNVLPGALAFWATVRMRETPRSPAAIDGRGQLLAVVAGALLTVAIVEAGHRSPVAPAALLPLLAAAIAIAVLVALERAGRASVVPPALLRSRLAVVVLAGGAAFSVAIYGALFAFGLLFQQRHGLSPLLAGVAFLPFALLAPLGNASFGRAMRRAAPARLLALGAAGSAGGLLLLAAAPELQVWAIALLLAPAGLASGFTASALPVVLLSVVPAAATGAAAGLQNATRQLGSALGVASFGALVAGASFADGLRIAVVLAAGLLLGLAAAIAVVLRRPPAPRTSACTVGDAA
ncbi:MFS transporter [Patulibacter defluvii]|uniref:MFS transporter n=1 Tax=Patulibacter defluvii TaxID=3095358 RepID=UPI002A763838|nr:MFS transporter [Patulibacter sp. DM4]